MAKSKNRRKSPKPAPIDMNVHSGISLGFGQNKARKAARDTDREIQRLIFDAIPNSPAAG